ncbi:hypothetical protein BV22DRAFT_1200129 [Leucogyrophana mollusca]|uniref:Uncharacterized protein n=1 Tax=Leucogyrophana mollusca TaxID=85980 RepID=A0ACB8AXM9_9AGAM|nr:hypothetical protein BV22DRAFT_1200129 [Leucogyrophana mollusca]
MAHSSAAPPVFLHSVDGYTVVAEKVQATATVEDACDDVVNVVKVEDSKLPIAAVAAVQDSGAPSARAGGKICIPECCAVVHLLQLLDNGSILETLVERVIFEVLAREYSGDGSIPPTSDDDNDSLVSADNAIPVVMHQKCLVARTLIIDKYMMPNAAQDNPSLINSQSG